MTWNGSRRLADLLAVAAGELLADMLDHFPLPRDDLQRLGDILAQLAQPRAAAAKANGRSRLDHPLVRRGKQDEKNASIRMRGVSLDA
jgi:hypothetical protein